MKKIFLILFLIMLVSGIAILKSRETGRVCFDQHCFSVELAETPAERAKGLMFREELDRKKGMLFVFSQERQTSFWMKNTLIPLDIIWLDENKEIVFIHKNSQPCSADECLSINPGAEAKYVLELNAGIADEIGLAEGDQAVIAF